jgi:5-methylcytosine-specific restriction endonuclease McrA
MSKQGWFSRNRHLYPPDWTDIANAVKTAAGWQCVACGAPHERGHILTVDHVVDSNPANCSDENLAALCQVCHLRRQGMRPLPKTKEEAVARLRARHEAEQSQMEMSL